jgi:hypothetical protein
MKQLLQGARALSPYLLVELLLPGGTLIALSLWLYQNKGRLPGWRDRAKSTILSTILWLFQHRRKEATDGQGSSATRTAAPVGAGGIDRLCTGNCA